MSDYERGYYYGLYKKRVHDDQMLSQKILGVIIAACGIMMQILVGMFEFTVASAYIVAVGIYLILTRKNYVKE